MILTADKEIDCQLIDTGVETEQDEVQDVVQEKVCEAWRGESMNSGGERVLCRAHEHTSCASKANAGVETVEGS